jgi:hypothetical protein
VARQEALDPSHEEIEHSNVDVIEDMWPVVIIYFNMRKIPKDTQDRPCTSGTEPIFDSLQSRADIGSLGILVLAVFRLEYC